MSKLNRYANMINTVDSKLAEISKIIKDFDADLSNLVDDRLTDFVNHIEKKSEHINLKGE